MPVFEKGVTMKHINYLITGILAISFMALNAVSNDITNYFSIRSQGLNTPRHMSGLVQQVYANDNDVLHGTLAAAFSYTRTFDNDDITRCLFGNSCCPTISISGSRVTDRNECDWLADYFFLPTDYKSSLSFNPCIDNILVDFNFFIGLDDWAPGVYLALYAPIVHSRWGLNLCETIEMKGTNSHVPGYFTPDTLQRNELFNNFTEYVEGKIVGPVTQTVSGVEYTTFFQRLNKARMTQDTLNQTRLADIRLAIGYDFVQSDHLLLGLHGLITAPTGNRPEGEYLFEPIIGNGHHWELGAGVQLYGLPWCSDDQDKQIIFSLNADFMHLFSARQRRTFDLQNKPFSRYMLIEKLTTPITNNLKGNDVTPSAQFKTEFLPVANLTNLCIKASSSLQAEITAMSTFVCDNFSWDIGYNFWFRCCEKISLRSVTAFENNSKWALKGDAHVFGYDRGAAGAGPLVGAVALSATQHHATITSGTNFTADHTVAQAILNPGVDNAQNSTGDGAGGANNNPLSAEPFDMALTIQTSVNPIFLSVCDLDVCTPKTSGLSNSLFTHFSYTWSERPEWIPYLGLGGQVEFAHNESSCSTDACDSCLSCAISQWAVWLKGGMTF